MIEFEYLHRLIFLQENLQKVHVPPKVYVPPQDNLMLADITAMYVEEFNLFLHYKQEKHFRTLVEMTVQMYSSRLVALYKT